MMNKLRALLLQNRAAPRAYRLENAANGEATIYLYDVIGYDWWTGGGVTAEQFAKDMRAVQGKTVHLRVNSPGGDVFDGRAMVAAIQQHQGKLIAHVDGLAASAASFLIMHADEIVMADGSFMMIHNGWTIALGDRHVMLDTAALLEKIDASIADDYEKKSGMSHEKIAGMMDAETWFTAKEAVDAGLANRVEEPASKDNAAAANAWNLAAYEHAPAALAKAPEVEPVEPPAPTANEPDFAAMHAQNDRALRIVESTAA